MLQSSIGQLKFWNKKVTTSNTQFLITSPNSLDNYFSTQRSKYSGGHLPIPIQFNQINQQQSLDNTLSKKIKGIRLSKQSEKLLQRQLSFINKINNHKIYFTINELFSYYLDYKSQELAKARINNQVNQKIIKPFIRITTACNLNEYQIQVRDKKAFNNKKLGHLFSMIFKQILKENINQSNNANSLTDEFRIQKFNTEDHLKNNNRVVEEADKIIKKIQENNGNLQNKQEEQYRKNIRNIKNSNKPTSCLPISTKRIKIQKQFNSTSRTNTRMRSQKNAKFKTINSTQKDIEKHTENSFDLCQELGLLIQDTDKILKPLMENSYEK